MLQERLRKTFFPTLLMICFYTLSSHAESSSLHNSGLDMTRGDVTVKPGDDFFDFANGAWVARTEIQSDRPGASMQYEMVDRVTARLRTMMEESSTRRPVSATDVRGKIGAYYKSYMDETRIEALGAKPIEGYLRRVRATRSRDALAMMMGRSNFDFDWHLFWLGVVVDAKSPDRNALMVVQSGLGLPDRDYYLDPGHEAARTAYLAYIEKILSLIGWEDPAARAQDILNLETRIASVSWSGEQEFDDNAIYNPMSLHELERFSPGFNWKGFFASAGLDSPQRVIVREKSAFPKIAAEYQATPLPLLKAWTAFHIADTAAPYLSRDFQEAWFSLYQRTLSGQKEQAPRWQRAISQISGSCLYASPTCLGPMGWGVAQIYSADWFTPDAKNTVEDIVRNVKTAYRARIEGLDWLSGSTRQQALEKLEKYRVKIGYPEKTRNYGSVVIRENDLVANVLRLAADDWTHELQKLRQPVDKTEWDMTPQTVNAMSSPKKVEITFPAGVLQPPAFNPEADPAVNYGAVGAGIGHELTHGFDDRGRNYDADGILRDWWTASDAQEFEARAARLGKQYDAYEPVPGVHVNGKLTLGENIADLGGLTLALDAYHASLKGGAAPVIDGLTGDQRVFLGWAQYMCSKYTQDYLRKQVSTDPHSPKKFRVNGVVRNMDAWYAAFDVKPGDTLYLPPEERVRIW